MIWELMQREPIGTAGLIVVVLWYVVHLFSGLREDKHGKN